MKKIVLAIAMVLLLASCGGGGSSDEAKELQTHILKLVGIPQEIVVNICQDDNDNGRCDVGELQAKVTVNKSDSVAQMWAKVTFEENGRYILENYDPTKSIIMEIDGRGNENYNNVDLNLKYKPTTTELSVLQAVIDADFLTEEEAARLKASADRLKIDLVLFNSLTQNQELLEDENLSTETALAINLEAIAQGLRDLNVSTDLPEQLAACNSNNTCLEAIVLVATEEIKLTEEERQELARSKKVVDGYIVKLIKPVVASCVNGKEYNSSLTVKAQGTINFDKFPVGTECDISISAGSILDSNNNGTLDNDDKELAFEMIGSADDTFISPLTTLLYRKKKNAEDVIAFDRMIQNYNPVVAPSRAMSNTGIEKVKIEKLIILMEVLKIAMKQGEDITKLDLSKVVTTSSTETIEDFNIDLLINNLSVGIKASIKERAETIRKLILMLASLDPKKISLDSFFVSISDGGLNVTDALKASLLEELPAGMNISDFVLLSNVSEGIKEGIKSEIIEIDSNTTPLATTKKFSFPSNYYQDFDYNSHDGST